ncbi:MAG: prolyl-tRNA synthetase [Bradymonadia bacterium]|jgi:prolyl-tRNA synthetase
MRMTRLHAPTLKENPKDAEVVSHKLLVRGGYVRKLAAGIYDYLPLANRVLRKIETIVREELDAADAQEVRLPVVQPSAIWEESGRWGQYGPELLRVKDRKGNSFCLGPTHEEVMVDLVRRDVNSWKALPLNLYQIQVKFRDEIRPRAGLMRGREFIMKDAYSFDLDDDAANASYDAMYAAYERIFTRCGLDFRAVEADTGAIGGSRSHEFQVLADSGEDAIVSCSACDFAANVEQAQLTAPALEAGEPSAAAEQVATPGTKSIAAVSALLDTSAEHIIKTLIVDADGQLHAVLVRGDHQVNLIKVKKLLGAAQVDLAADLAVFKATGAPVGYIGPVDLVGVESVIADHAVANLRDAVCGANAKGAHLKHVDAGRDFEAIYADARMAEQGDSCPRCDGHLRAYRGIEVGHVFFLGTKYSEAMRCTVLDETGRERPLVMGCYGIGVSRVLAAAVEQNHDQNGIVWPASLAPFQVSVLPLQMNKPEVVEVAEAIYAELKAAGVEVLLDDRNERAGGKFKDADLVGAPWRIAIGARGLKTGEVELKPRAGGDNELVPLADVVSILRERLG